ncbi:MAG: acyltransferase [Polyangiaceae bacterium]|nr:acyltransferase [Polyangiaceae bacterium]
MTQPSDEDARIQGTEVTRPPSSDGPSHEGSPTQLRPSRSGQDHLPVLDGIRGIAILAVLLVHFGSSEMEPALRTGSWFERAYDKLASTGGCGVDLFFVLSGFLITRILLRARGKKNAWRNFYSRRVLRIFPLYYFALTLVFVLVPVVSQQAADTTAELRSHQIWLWTYANNYTPLLGMELQQSWLNLNHFWSLAVEEQFYLVWPFLVFWLPARRIFWVLGGLVLTAVATKLVLLDAGNRMAAYMMTPCRFDALAMGGALAYLSARRGGLLSFLPTARWLLVGAAGTLALIGAVSRSAPWLWWTTAVVHTAFPVLFTAVVALAIEAQPPILNRLLCFGFVRFFGKYSYGIYVWHGLMYSLFPIFLPVAWFEHVVGHRLLGVFAFTVVASGASVVAALASWNLVENPFLGLKSRFT